MTYIINTSSAPEIIRYYTNATPPYPAAWYVQGGVLMFDYNSPNTTMSDPTGLCAINSDAWTLPVGDYRIKLKWRLTYSSTPTSQSYNISRKLINPVRYLGSGTVTSLEKNYFSAYIVGEYLNSLNIEGEFLCRITNANASIKFSSHPFSTSQGGTTNLSSTDEYNVIAERYPVNTF